MSKDLFERFWLAGMRKISKKKAKPLFNRVLKERNKDVWISAEEFVDFLILDIQTRLQVKQFGFKEMHPTTYLNGERWDDEIVMNIEPARI